jgi:hypothetical protein
MHTIDEKLQAYSSFFVDMAAGFGEVDKVFERLVTKALELGNTFGNLDEDEEAGEEANAQLSKLRILERDFYGFMKNFDVSVSALRDELDKKIEFGQAMLEGMEVGG